MTVVVRGEVYAQVARGLRFTRGSMTLVDLSPSTIWLSPTPTPGLGCIPTGTFLDQWSAPAQGRNPRARRVKGTLCLLDPDAQLAGPAVLTLSNPRVSASGLTYDAAIVEGLIPTDSGACVLFLEWDRAPMGADRPVPPSLVPRG